MGQATSPVDWNEAAISARLVRYRELKPCKTAFIDARTPGSAEKENFTIIGPGVAESPDQHVHIDIPHGFNIGAARQPPGCVNSQHAHETAEVFIVHSGRWAFYLGPNREDGEVIVEPGDTISIPIHVFRGFENVGDTPGFMFAVLGGDDPGHVTWAPYVFEAAREHGLVLLQDGSLVDTANGESVPRGNKPMSPTTVEEADRLRGMTGDDLAKCIMRHAELRPASEAVLAATGYSECPVIGSASEAEGLEAGKMNWLHGFHLRHIAIEPGAGCRKHVRHEEEVLMVHNGELTFESPDAEMELGPGDVLTVPIDMPRRYANRGSEIVEAYVVRGGDAPEAPGFSTNWK